MLTLALGVETMLSIKEVASRLGISVMTVRRLIWDGELPAYKIGGRLKVDPDALERYRQSSAYQPKARDDEAQP